MKKFIVIVFILLSIYNVTIAQDYTYSSSPAIGTPTSCPADCRSFKGGICHMTLTSVNATSFTFKLSKCDGTAITSSGRFSVGWDTDMQCTSEGTNSVSIAGSSTLYSKSITVPASWSSNGTKSYWTGVYYNGTNYYYCGLITITRTPVEPTSPNPPSTVSTSLSGNDIIVNWSSSAGASSGYKVYVSTDGGSYNFMKSTTSTTYTFTTGNPGSNYCFKIVACNSTCSDLSTQYSCQTIPNAIQCNSPSGVNCAVGVNNANVTWGAISGAVNYEIRYRQDGYTNYTYDYPTTNSYNITPLVNNTTYYYDIRTVCTNFNNSSYTSGSFTTIAATKVISLSGDLIFGNVQQSSSSTKTFIITNNGNSQLYVSSINLPQGFSADWTTGYINAGSTKSVNITFSPTQSTSYSGTVTINSDATSGNNTFYVSGSGTPIPFPDPIAATNAATNITSTSATLNATVNPNGSNTACLFQYGTTTSYGTNTNTVTLTGSSQTTSVTISGLHSNTTYYYRIRALNSSGNVIYGAATSFKTLASDCVYSDCNSTTNCGNTNYQAETYNAIQYLCSKNIIKGISGKALPDSTITRAQLAKIALYGVYGDSLIVPVNLVTDSFPSPYADLQIPTTYYYKAAKALMYLDFGDGVTPFDRDRLFFNPTGKISRRLVLKVLMETFNIAPATSGNNPFTDFSPSDEFWGYAMKAYSLGITTSTAFRPTANCTRAEAFIFLYRIMTNATNLFPTISNTLVPSTSSFYIPMNIRLENMSAYMGIENGNFNNYTKSCFSIAGPNLSMDFGFNYNSYVTELPSELFPLNPLGTAWTHTYNMYMNFIYGPTVYDTKFAIHMPDGSLLIYKLDANNKIVPLTEGNFNTLTNVTSMKYELKTKSQVVYTFEKKTSTDIAYVLTSVKGRNGNAITLTYTAGNSYTVPETSTTYTTQKIASVSDPAGRSLIFNYSAGDNLLTSVTDPINRTINFKYTNGQLTQFTDATGTNTTIYSYGTTAKESNLLKTITLPKGNVIKNTYFQRKLTSTQYNNNTPTTVTHTPNYISGNTNYNKSTVTTQVAGKPVSTNYEMDKLGNVTKVDGNSSVNFTQSFTNSALHTLPTTITNNLNGLSVTPTYDAVGNVTKVITSGTGGLSTSESFKYNSLNDITEHADANGKTSYYYYTNGNLTSIQDAEGNTTNIQNNTSGQPTSITDPANIVMNFGYDAYGNQNSVNIPSLGINSYSTYDKASRLIGATNFANQTNSFTFDENDNVLSETDALQHSTNYVYDKNENLTKVINAKNIVATTLNYDSQNDWLLSEVSPVATKSYQYNDDGSLSKFTSPNGYAFNSVYDNVGRLIDDGYATYTYAANGNLATITKDSKAISFSYDGLNRISGITYNGNTVSYTYDNVGNVMTITYPGSKTVSYAYDGTNKLKTVTDWIGNITSYNYRGDSQLDYVLYPNGVKTIYSYDVAGRPTGISIKRSNGNGTTIADYSFKLDSLGNHTQENINEPYTAYPLISNNTQNYSYTSSNRIQAAGISYDNNGNTTTKNGYTMGYDVANNLTTVSGNLNASFTYDGAGNRRSGTRNGIITNYILDVLGMSNVLMETDANGNPQNYYVYGLGLISRIKPTNATSYYVYDFRGSTVAIVDGTSNANITHKYQYDDFGKVLQMQEADYNPFRYIGRYGVMYEDSTLLYMRARYYDSSVGRFLSEDPVWSTNLYPYANNNPINLIDFNGKEPQSGDVQCAIYFHLWIENYQKVNNVNLGIDLSGNAWEYITKLSNNSNFISVSVEDMQAGDIIIKNSITNGKVKKGYTDQQIYGHIAFITSANKISYSTIGGNNAPSKDQAHAWQWSNPKIKGVTRIYESKGLSKSKIDKKITYIFRLVKEQTSTKSNSNQINGVKDALKGVSKYLNIK